MDSAKRQIEVETPAQCSDLGGWKAVAFVTTKTYSALFRNKELLNKELDPRSGQDLRLGQEPRFLRDSLETP